MTWALARCGAGHRAEGLTLSPGPAWAQAAHLSVAITEASGQVAAWLWSLATLRPGPSSAPRELGHPCGRCLHCEELTSPQRDKTATAPTLLPQSSWTQTWARPATSGELDTTSPSPVFVLTVGAIASRDPRGRGAGGRCHPACSRRTGLAAVSRVGPSALHP